MSQGLASQISMPCLIRDADLRRPREISKAGLSSRAFLLTVPGPRNYVRKPKMQTEETLVLIFRGVGDLGWPSLPLIRDLFARDFQGWAVLSAALAAVAELANFAIRGNIELRELQISKGVREAEAQEHAGS